jgi:ribonuclease PH
MLVVEYPIASFSTLSRDEHRGDFKIYISDIIYAALRAESGI